jgi:hypothetical protein
MATVNNEPALRLQILKATGERKFLVRCVHKHAYRNRLVRALCGAYCLSCIGQTNGMQTTISDKGVMKAKYSDSNGAVYRRWRAPCRVSVSCRGSGRPRSCQRHTTGLVLPDRRMISLVPQP